MHPALLLGGSPRPQALPCSRSWTFREPLSGDIQRRLEEQRAGPRQGLSLAVLCPPRTPGRPSPWRTCPGQTLLCCLWPSPPPPWPSAWGYYRACLEASLPAKNIPEPPLDATGSVFVACPIGKCFLMSSHDPDGCTFSFSRPWSVEQPGCSPAPEALPLPPKIPLSSS